MKLNLFPAPRRVSIKKSTLDLRQAEWIVLPQAPSDALRARAVEAAARMGERLNRPIRVTTATLPAAEAMVTLKIQKGIPAQGSELVLNAKERTLSASDESGLFYGLLALGQLVEQFGNAVPSLTVSDAPDFPARGIMMDVSRCKVPTLATLKQLIDRLAGLRINQLQLYIEHTF
ncbi:MAG: glycoside hydrolase family 20 zincin-like fold domain-containing protein, partial [Planctomycetota bacterium]